MLPKILIVGNMGAEAGYLITELPKRIDTEPIIELKEKKNII